MEVVVATWRGMLLWGILYGLWACAGEGGTTGRDAAADPGSAPEVLFDAGGDAAADAWGKDAAAEGEVDAAADGAGDPGGGPDATGLDAAEPAPFEVAETLADQAADPGDGPDAASDSPADTGPACTPEPPVAADGPRTVLVTHPFSSESGVCGRGLEVLRLAPDGTLSTTGDVLDVGNCPTRVVFSPDGRLALVLTNNNDPQAGDRSLVVLRHHADGGLELAGALDQFALRAVEDVAFSLDGTRAYVTDDNVVGQGGVHEIAVQPGCGASYVRWIDLHHASSITMLPDGLHAAVLAGPVYNDPKDLAFVDLASSTVVGQTANFTDFVTAASLAASPDGKTLLVPNDSPFSSLGNTLTVLSLSPVGGVPVPAIRQVVTDVETPTEVLYSVDGSKVLVTSFEGDSVRWFQVGADGDLSGGGTVSGIGLADRADMLRRGPLAGTVLVSSVTDVARLRVTATGVEKLPKLPLGSGSDKICGDVAIEP